MFSERNNIDQSARFDVEPLAPAPSRKGEESTVSGLDALYEATNTDLQQELSETAEAQGVLWQDIEPKAVLIAKAEVTDWLDQFHQALTDVEFAYLTEQTAHHPLLNKLLNTESPDFSLTDLIAVRPPLQGNELIRPYIEDILADDETAIEMFAAEHHRGVDWLQQAFGEEYESDTHKKIAYIEQKLAEQDAEYPEEEFPEFTVIRRMRAEDVWKNKPRNMDHSPAYEFGVERLVSVKKLLRYQHQLPAELQSLLTDWRNRHTLGVFKGNWHQLLTLEGMIAKQLFQWLREQTDREQHRVNYRTNWGQRQKLLDTISRLNYEGTAVDSPQECLGHALNNLTANQPTQYALAREASGVETLYDAMTIAELSQGLNEYIYAFKELASSDENSDLQDRNDFDDLTTTLNQFKLRDTTLESTPGNLARVEQEITKLSGQLGQLETTAEIGVVLDKCVDLQSQHEKLTTALNQVTYPSNQSILEATLSHLEQACVASLLKDSELPDRLESAVSEAQAVIGLERDTVARTNATKIFVEKNLGGHEDEAIQNIITSWDSTAFDFDAYTQYVNAGGKATVLQLVTSQPLTVEQVRRMFDGDRAAFFNAKRDATATGPTYKLAWMPKPHAIKESTWTRLLTVLCRKQSTDNFRLQAVLPSGEIINSAHSSESTAKPDESNQDQPHDLQYWL